MESPTRLASSSAAFWMIPEPNATATSDGV